MTARISNLTEIMASPALPAFRFVLINIIYDYDVEKRGSGGDS